MDKLSELSELGTARGWAEQRVKRAKRELAEAEFECLRATAAYWEYHDEASPPQPVCACAGPKDPYHSFCSACNP